LALPGGFVEFGESWQEAGARELYEEAGVVIAPQTLAVQRVFSAPDGTLIICGRAPRLRSTDLPTFTPTAEASERTIVLAPTPMAWPLHAEVIEEYLAQRRDGAGRTA
jgi:ADP-ribose pyrophosphatase YjhB (NUDIX family)